MKVTLEFTLPEERCEHRIAVTAMDWALTVLDIDNWLREKLKHGHPFKTADEALENARMALNDILGERNLSTDMIE